MACARVKQVRKNPLVHLARNLRWQVHKPDAALPGNSRPTDLPMRIHAQAGKSQLEAHPNPLLQAKRSDSLNPDSFAVQIADDSTVSRIESNVRQRTQFMPIVGACVPRGKRYHLHTHRRK
jgi:hypothetical protein